jgi:hypothetical protein
MRRWGVVVATLVVGALGASAAAGPTADVTLRVDRRIQPGNNIWQFRFSGTISSGEVGEYVAILGRTCGMPNASWIATAGASTGPGGAYTFTTNEPPDYKNLTISPPAYYRARWKNADSDPVLLRGRLTVGFNRVARLRYRATVGTSTVGPLNLRGRIAELQRLTGGTWRRIKTARFVVFERSSFITTFGATFSVPAGSTLRVAVPAQSVGPCYDSAVSMQWSTR